MLRLMLDSHPDLAIPGESHFIVNKYRRQQRYSVDGRFDSDVLLKQITASSHFKRWEIPADLVFERAGGAKLLGFADTIAHLFKVYALVHGKTRWGDKTPVYVRSINLLAELFPTALFVHIIRDGHNVAMSYLSVPWGPRSIWEVARKWKVDVGAGIKAGRRLGPSRYMELRYEDLVSDPEVELKGICHFAGLEFIPSMLDFYQDAAGRLQTPYEDFHQSATRAPERGMRDWTTQMSDADVLAFEAVAGRLLSELGYSRRFESIPIAKLTMAKAQEVKLSTQVAGSRFWRALQVSRAASQSPLE